MKKLQILLLAMLFVPAISGAQGKVREKMERLKAMKVAFITNELSLTSDEAAKFWPVYNEFEARQKTLRRQMSGSYKSRMESGSMDNLSDKEAAVALSQMEESEDKMHQLRRKFIADLKAILPPAKILKLKKAEEDFNKKLLQQYRAKAGRK